MSDTEVNPMVNEDTVDQGCTVGSSDSNPAVNDNLVNVKPLECCFIERIDKEMGTIGATVEDRIQNAILIAIDSNITPKIELAIWSVKASSGELIES